MTNLINTLTAALSNALLFLVACAMAGLGFAFLGMITLFAFVAMGVALIVAPFAMKAETAPADAEVSA